MLLVAGLALSLSLAGCGGGGSGPGTAPSPDTRSEIAVVRLPVGTSIDDIARRYGAEVTSEVSGKGIYGLKGSKDLVERLQGDPELLSVEHDDDVVAPEPVVGDPFHFPTDFRANPVTSFDTALRTLIDAPPGGGFGRGRANEVIVAVLDTGVARNHPALQGRLLGGFNALKDGASEDEVTDGVHNRGISHGTMVAGVIARLAPEAKILPIRVLNADGIGSVLSLTRGIQYALAHGAKVINLSCEISRRSDALKDLLDDLEDQGVVLVASAGNSNVTVAPYPAAAEHAIAVGAVEGSRVKSAYSNYGSWVSVVAPGTGMESAWWSGGYASWSGTSFAAPCVAAEAALLLAAFPNLEVDKVRDVIQRSARSVDSDNPNFAGRLGNGLIQIQAALDLAQRED